MGRDLAPVVEADIGEEAFVALEEAAVDERVGMTHRASHVAPGDPPSRSSIDSDISIASRRLGMGRRIPQRAPQPGAPT